MFQTYSKDPLPLVLFAMFSSSGLAKLALPLIKDYLRQQKEEREDMHGAKAI